MYGCVWLGRPTIHKLKTEYQWFKRISAGLTGFSGIKIAYRGRKKLLDNGVFFLSTNCTDGHELFQWIEWRPGRSHELALMQ